MKTIYFEIVDIAMDYIKVSIDEVLKHEDLRMLVYKRIKNYPFYLDISLEDIKILEVL
jgi:hypothetical protein